MQTSRPEVSHTSADEQHTAESPLQRIGIASTTAVADAPHISTSSTPAAAVPNRLKAGEVEAAGAGVAAAAAAGAADVPVGAAADAEKPEKPPKAARHTENTRGEV